MMNSDLNPTIQKLLTQSKFKLVFKLTNNCSIVSRYIYKILSLRCNAMMSCLYNGAITIHLGGLDVRVSYSVGDNLYSISILINHQVVYKKSIHDTRMTLVYVSYIISYYFMTDKIVTDSHTFKKLLLHQKKFSDIDIYDKLLLILFPILNDDIDTFYFRNNRTLSFQLNNNIIGIEVKYKYDYEIESLYVSMVIISFNAVEYKLYKPSNDDIINHIINIMNEKKA